MVGLIIARLAFAVIISVLAVAGLMGAAFLAELWLGLAIALEASVGTGLAGVVALLPVVAIVYGVLYAFDRG